MLSWFINKMHSRILAMKFQTTRKFFKNIFSKVKDFLEKSPFVRTLLVFSLFLLSFTYVYFSVTSLASGDDHFFHFRFAETIRENGLFESFKNFDSIYFSKIAQSKDYFVYYNFLFYVIIIPFTFINPLYLGIKLYAVLAISLLFTTLYWCLRKFRITNPFVWTILLFSLANRETIWRFFLSRPYAFAPALLMLLLVAIYKKKGWWAFLISFIYIYWHSATFFFPIFISLTYLIFEGFYGKKMHWKVSLYVLSGTTLAIALVYLIPSNFLLYMKEVIFGIYNETIVGQKIDIPEGRELYPISFFDFVSANLIMFVFFIMAGLSDIVRYSFYRKGLISDDGKEEPFSIVSPLRSSLLFMSLIFFVGTLLVSQRFNDFFVFFVALYVALSFESVREYISISKKEIKVGIIAGAIVAVSYLFASNLIGLQEMLGAGPDANNFAEVGKWLRENTKKGDIVFNPNWTWFTQLYYHSPQNRYIAGLEPRFLYSYNSKLYWLFSNIAQGFVCFTPKCPVESRFAEAALRKENDSEYYEKEGKKVSAALLDVFHSKYIVSSNRYAQLNDLLTHSKNFKQVLDDKGVYYIFEVLR